MEQTSARNILFGALPPLGNVFERYLDHGMCRKVFQNERIFLDEASSEVSGVLYVREGRLKLASHRPISGMALNFCFYGPQTMLEYRADLFPHHSGQMYIEACENSVVYRFTHETLLEILRQDAELLDRYNQFRAAGMSLLCQRMELTACLDAEQRVAGWLMELCRREPGGEDGSYSIPCPLTQQEIADYLLIHVTTFNRMFSKLKHRAIAEKKRGRILVHDFKQLQSIYEQVAI